MAAWGFHYYLTQFCRCQVSWDADQLNLPETLPEVSVRIVSLDKWECLCQILFASPIFHTTTILNLKGFVTTRTLARSAIVLLGGSGHDGNVKSIGWQ